ncbi:MAG: sensor domain-containing diguanylate cyclase [Thermodesulfobacteriota bacterium]
MPVTRPALLGIGYALAGAVAYFAVAGGYEAFPPLLAPAAALTALLLGVIANRFLAPEDDAFSRQLLEGCGLAAAAFALYRMFDQLAWQSVLLPFGYLGWLAATSPRRDWLPPAALVLLLGFATSARGLSPPLPEILNWLLFGAGIFLLHRRPPAGKTRIRPPQRMQSVVSGETTIPVETPASGGDVPVEQVKDLMAEILRLELERLHGSLELISAVLLVRRGDGYRIRSAVSSSDQLVQGAIRENAGILAGLQQGRDLITMAEIRTEAPLVPYYGKGGVAGSVLALRIVPLFRATHVEHLLCVDRAEKAHWTDDEINEIREGARRLGTHLTLQAHSGRLIREHDRMQRLSHCLIELNGVLGLESVYQATEKAVSAYLSYDTLAISLREGDRHLVIYMNGPESGHFLNQSFSVDEGLVGQALRTNHWLPASGSYPRPVPAFCREQPLPPQESLLILPFTVDGDKAIGALTIASASTRGLYTGVQREMLQLIAAQVAVKIDLAQAHEKISRLATTDGLTGLANHRTFQHGFDMMLERTRRNQCPLCLILCDIDFFKRINDTYGHPFGDQVLRRVAEVLRKAVRKVDLAARYGGEEFALLLESADELGGRQFAERIRQEIAGIILLHEREPVSVTISMGLAFCPKDADDKAKLISHADQALYKAKALGRNRTMSWSDIVMDSQ